MVAQEYKELEIREYRKQGFLYFRKIKARGERISDGERKSDFRRHAFGRIMNSVVDRVVVRIVAEIQRSSAIAESFPQVSLRMSRVVFASLISASGITFTSETISDN
ncbi:hypothetical protein L6452_18495 [Arctium lappa]|uniref:Uncharacterized protein n=1 Tax=Arctium lappa TaxID=4217 RepID=A0ACB9C6G6_ARCLA|nr:hypothetical protein L6452_18495 [Arctium lappa]